MTKDTDLRSSVVAAMAEYAQAYSRKDLESIVGMTTDGFFGFGSGADERVSNKDELRAQIQRDLDQVDEVTVEFAPGPGVRR